MTPPRATDPADGADPADGVDSDVVYETAIAEMAELQGLINVAEGRLVEVIGQALATGVSGGDNLPPAKWVAWRAGVSPGRAHDLVRLAERSDELPATLAALGAGELTLDQAAEIARHVPARYDASAARVAQCCTVKQLRQALPWYRDPKPDKPKPGEVDEQRTVSTGYDERGYYAIFRLPEAEGAVFDQALKATHEDLKRQARADAAADGSDPVPVYAADALVAMAEDSLQAGEAVRPGTDRYLVHVHLENGPNGLQLMTHLGIVLPEGQRRHIGCDARLRGIVHDGIAPIGAGRTTRVISRRLRRAIEHRDRGCCAVPGCGRTTNLEIHHIWHWEDGGPTETGNLITLCAYHHACHHQGTLGIEGNADLPRHTAPGVVFTNHRGHLLDPVGKPIVPRPPTSGASPVQHTRDAAATIGLGPHAYEPPTGERMDRSQFHLQEAHPLPGPTPGGDPNDGAPPDTPTPPGTPGGTHRPDQSPPPPTSPQGPGGADPTRAGPGLD